jgi:cation diffusion facilitator family transporter
MRQVASGIDRPILHSSTPHTALFSNIITRYICKIIIYKEVVVVSYDYKNNDDNHNNNNDNNTNGPKLNGNSLATTIKSAFLRFKKRRTSSLEEKLRVAVTSIIASASLALLKFVVGLSTNSLGILSESLHSGLDFVAAMMTLYAVRIVMRPRDSKYTYGYAKFESISSLSQILLLFAVAGWVFYEGIERILAPETIQPEITVLSFAIMFVSIAVDLGRSRALYRTARKYGSQALEADALHFRTDMLSSAIVLIGLSLVFFLDIPNADAYAAIVVAAMIVYTSLGLGRRTLDVLLDKAPKGVYHQILESVSGLEGVDRPHDIRIRKMGPETFVDMHIEVPRTYTHDTAHKVATIVEEKVKQILPNSDVLVHVDATKYSNETINDRIRLIAAETHGITNVHSIYMSNIRQHSVVADNQEQENRRTSDLLSNDLYAAKQRRENHKNCPELRLRLHLYLDVQMDSELDLTTAHNITESFEDRLKQEIPQIKNVTTHIEIEEAGRDTSTIGIEKRSNEAYIERIKDIALSIDSVVACKDVAIVEVNGDKHITLTIKIESRIGKSLTTLRDAHEIATNVQNRIINQTGATRVVVHTEPS